MRVIGIRSVLRIGLVAAALALAVFVLGCGSNNSSGSSSSASPSTVAAVVDGSSIAADPNLHALLPPSTKSSGVIKCASGLSYPPWEMYVKSSGGAMTGFDYDLSQAIGAKLGVKVEFINSPFDSIILSIMSGKYDMTMTDMYDNAQREKTLTFVDYAYDSTAIMVAKGNPDGITNLDSLSGKSVACNAGQTQQGLLVSLNKKFQNSGKSLINILTYQTDTEAVLAVESGKAAAYVSDQSPLTYIVKSTSTGSNVEVLSDPAAPHGYDPSIVGIGILKSNTQLVTAVQKALQALMDQGSYKKIIDKYGLLPVDSALINDKPASAYVAQ